MTLHFAWVAEMTTGRKESGLGCLILKSLLNLLIYKSSVRGQYDVEDDV